MFLAFIFLRKSVKNLDFKGFLINFKHIYKVETTSKINIFKTEIFTVQKNIFSYISGIINIDDN